MFGIGTGELIVIAIIALIALGPERLPTVLRTLGRASREIKKATQDLRQHTGIDELLHDDALRDPLRRNAPPARKLAPARALIDDAAREREQPEEGVDVQYARRHEESP